MKSLFDSEALREINDRLEKLDENSARQWGKMTHGQMMHHCQGPLNIILKKDDYNLKPNWVLNTFFKKSLYNDKLWRQGLPTAKPFKETKDRNFNEEKSNLKSLLNEFQDRSDELGHEPHPSFGKLTKQQWGQMQYKHLDHHFRQFGV